MIGPSRGIGVEKRLELYAGRRGNCGAAGNWQRGFSELTGNRGFLPPQKLHVSAGLVKRGCRPHSVVHRSTGRALAEVLGGG